MHVNDPMSIISSPLLLHLCIECIAKLYMFTGCHQHLIQRSTFREEGICGQRLHMLLKETSIPGSVG